MNQPSKPSQPAALNKFRVIVIEENGTRHIFIENAATPKEAEGFALNEFAASYGEARSNDAIAQATIIPQ